MHILVTGGGGFIGSHLVDALIADGHKVTVIDDLSTGKKENLHKQAKFVKANVIDVDVFAPLLKDVDGCFHLAAIASVERSRKEWYYAHQVNAGGIVNLFHAITKTNRTIPVVYASSAAIYGNSKELPLSESATTVPLTAYGADKLACEQHGRVAVQIHNIPNIGLRFFNVYGPRQDPTSPYSGVISIFSDRIAQGQPITIYGKGEQSRDFVYVADVVRCMKLAMEQLKAEKINIGVFNVCTGAPTTVSELVDILGDVTGRKPQIEFKPERRGDIRRSLGNPALAISMLDFCAEISLKEGLHLSFKQH